MMQPLSVVSVPSSAHEEELELSVPSWTDLLSGGGFFRTSARVRWARGLGPAAFREATTRAYLQIQATLHKRGILHPVRLWNYIPGIHDPMNVGQDRYMSFNAGRFEALCQWLGGAEQFDTLVASASGVGHEGQDLIIHCLAADHPGRAVANPRQIAPYRYSRRYGPLPPCFARATVVEGRAGEPLVLVGGTASIAGEESVHVGDLPRQTEETLTNLAVLVREAAGAPVEPAVGDTPERAAALARYRDVRVYYRQSESLSELRHLLRDAFPGALVEWVRADICREDLLVEIEGVAEL
jgi:enamine deaminase RidA (YjgF/YER057c/UK114 family)